MAEEKTGTSKIKNKKGKQKNGLLWIVRQEMRHH